MTFHQLPQSQGLYHPSFEHDACGIGLYAHIKGKSTHDIVKKGIEMLTSLDHRGGKAADGMTGDGAGIMVDIPDRFFRKNLKNIQLPSKGYYGVGMLFLTENEREEIEYYINETIRLEKQILLGWRTVPINQEQIGEKARQSCPVVRQVFIGSPGEVNQLNFERKLYVIRKQVEKWAKEHGKELYFSSLSSSTIVYKGLLNPDQLDRFYLDLQDEDFVSRFSLVHSRYSTNTFPSWERAHPNRYLLHNGEINTLRGNINWMKAREKHLAAYAFGADAEKIMPVLDVNGSDSSILDNAFEFFVLSGMPLAQVAMMLVPEPWSENKHISAEKRAFYQYQSLHMEPWDGPAAIMFSNGKQIGAVLDRNGLRPARYYVTKDDYIIFASEVGVIDVEPEKILYKERLSPGKMLLLDLEEGRIISDEETKLEAALAWPYQEWLQQELVLLNDQDETEEIVDHIPLRQKALGYTYEDIHKYLLPLVIDGKDPVGSMGNDMPLAVLSERPQSLFNYFKQLFAQVTNPPIDSIREKIVTSTVTYLGAEGNILKPGPENCRRIELKTPLLTAGQFKQLIENQKPDFQHTILSTVFTDDLETELENLLQEAEKAVNEGITLLILSDEKMDKAHVPMPPLLVISALHHRLIEKGLRTKASIIVASGEVREVHHFASCIGFGADAIYPYLVYATYQKAIQDGDLDLSYAKAVQNYVKAITDGIVKVMAKMGISTIQSYRGAQIFEALGISNEVIDRYFHGTVSQIGGIHLDTIAKEAILRHEAAYSHPMDSLLESGSDFQYRVDGEQHAFNPLTIHTLQWAVRKGDYQLFKKYTKLANDERIHFLRNLFTFKKRLQPVPIEEVEPVENIVKRFKTGAMSFGSISKEAHETLAIAMNRLGGKSNSGEGGEDAARYKPDANGGSRKSRIKQIASGRFGVKSHYLVNADELQIKMAQGAKPGEGGQLPGNKVYPWVAEVRGSTPGVGLISPPPNHDIYSIEDLAQLIFDLKNANRDARISVKLVSKAGVGTIAAGVAKGNAEVIVISGHDGGTGASPRTSIKHAGLPWELGLAEAHQTLLLNGLRDRVVLETDGKLMTGKDVVMAALLGAEEFGFATAPLISVGCVMMRVCHQDTCPVGIATQNPELRAKFAGEPEHVIHFMTFIAQEVREIMAQLGFRTVDEMVGRTDILEVGEHVKAHWKAKDLDLTRILYQPDFGRLSKKKQNHKLEETLDLRELLSFVRPAFVGGKKVEGTFAIKNTDRAVGTIVGSEVSKQYGEEGLPEDTIKLHFNGAAGQSFGAFVPKGMTLIITGDANDYFGKGLSGGKLIVCAPGESPFAAGENVIVGNVALYGATSGEVYINGRAGERFAVRNSGVHAVVEGIGDHGCEYMTGGRVVILGDVGKNFAAGMSGGIAYVLQDEPEQFKSLVNSELVEFESLTEKDEINEVKKMIEKHFEYTGSNKAEKVLANWDWIKGKFVKVIPKDYKQIHRLVTRLTKQGMTEEEAIFQAFHQLNEMNTTESAVPAVNK
ncbi:glutamate synthase large subunit [Caldifermentibacillus hisashii]|uniref:glutamate synthase large subunit n=1 Tax=Caldifermentibacillus hisashii TaxID=996558 RepID=UPI000BA31895|nr:glutamate synthase large subunit [Caldifermentibacillus hisashii]PAC37253.1 glutamate synthase large subunit [Caldifermentibacillus hisashii]